MAYYHEATLDSWYYAKKGSLTKDQLIKLLRQVAANLTQWPKPTDLEVNSYLRKKALIP